MLHEYDGEVVQELASKTQDAHACTPSGKYVKICMFGHAHEPHEEVNELVISTCIKSLRLKTNRRERYDGAQRMNIEIEKARYERLTRDRVGA